MHCQSVEANINRHLKSLESSGFFRICLQTSKMPSLTLDAASRALLRVVDPSTQFPSRFEIRLVQDVDAGRSPRLQPSMTTDAAQERMADNERKIFRAVARMILALRTD